MGMLFRYWIYGPNITYPVKGGVVGYTKMIKLGLAKLYHGRDHGFDFMIVRIFSFRTVIWTL